MQADPAIYQPRRVPASRFLTLRGLRHRVLEWGQASAAQPPLVLLHGWMDVAASFQFVVDALAADRHVIAMDWRGFGLSDPSGADAYWFPDYLGDLDALLDAVAPGAAVDLVGHSMGGNIVMSYAGVRPERIRRLVNLEGFGLPDADAERAPARLAEWLDALKAPAELRPYPELAGVAARLVKTNPRLPADKARWLAAHWAREDTPGRWIILGDPAHKRPNAVPYRAAEVLACWRRITAPLLWVEGAETRITELWADRFPRSEFDERLAQVRSVERRVVADAGHMLHHDQPQAVAALLEAFTT
ncbi:MAG: alpha/beta hydrolase [Pelomonas sp.]|nr:alpha/beta hydrolase [Roseateles sp.]